ncbi:MAG: F0F1 ATP synthase subunit delta [Corynebacterium sp.]|nr:F0F1 ATP synthase subunit delta [Corynebacterium sp.]
MHAASREALAQVNAQLDEALGQAGEGAIGVGAHIGAELFSVVEILDQDRSLRVALADATAAPAARASLAQSVFGSQISAATGELLQTASTATWSNPREYRTGLIAVGRQALLRSAESQGQLEKVEQELFQLSLLLDKQPELTLLLDDHSATPARRRELLASVLYGKVTAVTEALALQAIGRREHNAIDDIAALATTAAALRGRKVARVTTVTTLSEQQEAALASKLEGIYGQPIAIHQAIDASLLGGAVVRVDDEVIDGSLTGKLARLRTAFA